MPDFTAQNGANYRDHLRHDDGINSPTYRVSVRCLFLIKDTMMRTDNFSDEFKGDAVVQIPSGIALSVKVRSVWTSTSMCSTRRRPRYGSARITAASGVAWTGKHSDARPSLQHSMSCHDSTVAESFFNRLKRERIRRRTFRSREIAWEHLRKDIELFFNPKRRQVRNAMRSPA